LPITGKALTADLIESPKYEKYPVKADALPVDVLMF
jgi:hypothetical protein